MIPIDEWSSKFARVTSTVFGAPDEIKGWIRRRPKDAYVYFKDHPANEYRNRTQYRTSPHWVKRNGVA